MVAPVGLEPTTLSLEVSCSIQLSYGAILVILSCFAVVGKFNLISFLLLLEFYFNISDHVVVYIFGVASFYVLPIFFADDLAAS